VTQQDTITKYYVRYGHHYHYLNICMIVLFIDLLLLAAIPQRDAVTLRITGFVDSITSISK
jgi:hypothetical protein